MEASSEFHEPAALFLGEIAPGTHWTGDGKGHSAGVDAMEKRKIFHLPGVEPTESSP
jgi:hypothetical protein